MYKADFPFFTNNPDVVYLDSAATTQKPKVVIERITQYYTKECAPVGRNLYEQGIQATANLENVRGQAAVFLDAPEEGHVIFTAGATDALNLLAHGLASQLEPGDEIILSEAEHHANLVPWQEVARLCGARLIFIKSLENGQIDLNQLGEAFNPKTRIVTLSLISNVFGTILPVGEIQELLQKQGRRPWFILDASQAAAHIPLSVRTLGCDALVFAGHKTYAPSGLGILWGTTSLLEQLTPQRTGGGMINRVTLPETNWAAIPARFEAGSPNTEGILGLGAALSYLQGIGMDRVREHTVSLATVLKQSIENIPGIHLVGEPEPSSGIVSVTHDTIHPHDLAQFLADRTICVRAGHQCAQPLHASRNLSGSLRASVGLYNEVSDCERFGSVLREAVIFFTHA